MRYTIREGVSLLATEPRASLGYALGDLGDSIARLGRKVCDDVPTVGDSGDWFDAGYRVGERKGRREAAELSVKATGPEATA